MIIRKLFRTESAHIVRNCTSERCKASVHGHSAVIELFLEGKTLDNAQMLCDFGLLKGTVKEFIDSMDHCTLICAMDDPEYVKFMQDHSDRWIMLPFNPSAEMLSIFIHRFVQRILDHTKMKNGEGDVNVKGVRYHETVTGWAESSEEDVENLWNKFWDMDVCFSTGVIKDWSKDLKSIIFDDKTVENPKVKQQIKLK